MRRTDERVKLSEFLERWWRNRNISLDCSIWVLLCTGRCNRKLARGAHVAKRNAQPLEESGLDLSAPRRWRGESHHTISALNLRRYAGKLDRRDFLATLRVAEPSSLLTRGCP